MVSLTRLRAVLCEQMQESKQQCMNNTCTNRIVCARVRPAWHGGHHLHKAEHLPLLSLSIKLVCVWRTAAGGGLLQDSEEERKNVFPTLSLPLHHGRVPDLQEKGAEQQQEGLAPARPGNGVLWDRGLLDCRALLRAFSFFNESCTQPNPYNLSSPDAQYPGLGAAAAAARESLAPRQVEEGRLCRASGPGFGATSPTAERELTEAGLAGAGGRVRRVARWGWAHEQGAGPAGGKLRVGRANSLSQRSKSHEC